MLFKNLIVTVVTPVRINGDLSMKEKLIKDVHKLKKNMFTVNLYTDERFSEETTAVLYCIGELLDTAEILMRKELSNE